jgi:hypothetical protein
MNDSLLEQILRELKRMNLYLEEMTGSEIETKDVKV